MKADQSALSLNRYVADAVMSRWPVKRLRFLGDVNPSLNLSQPLPTDAEVTFLPMERVGERGDLDMSECRPFAALARGTYTCFRDGDVIVAKITPCFENGKGAICAGLRNGIGFGTTELHVLRPRRGLCPKFLYYVTASSLFRSFGEGSMKGAAGQKRVPEDFLRDFPLPFPDPKEQERIIGFLDDRCAGIDEIIAKKQRLIELLAEQKSALITRAVTRGLDPSVAMKDSGLQWLREVPSHWQVKRIKWIATMESGHTPDKKIPAYWENCDIPWVSLNDTGQLRLTDFITETAISVNALGIANSSARLLPPGSVVFSRDATVGLCAVTARTMAVSQHFIAWLCGPEILPQYLLFVLRAMVQDLESRTMGATIRTIGMPDIRTLAIPLPPVQEQEQIAKHVVDLRTRLEKIIGAATEQIDKLREYRAGLITAAVIGQIDVNTHHS